MHSSSNGRGRSRNRPRLRAGFAAGLILVAACALPAPASVQNECPAPPEASDALSTLRYLASDDLAGRLAGSRGERCAGEFIAARFAALGLAPGSDGYFQEFDLASAVNPHAPAGRGRNVVGILHGSDPDRRDEYIVIGAHYDHLGHGGSGSLAPGDSSVHNGADDNASGVTALLEIARRLAASPPARSVIFTAFSGEESGLLGSAFYASNPLFPLVETRAMLNLDMVGRLGTGGLIVSGVGTATEWESILAAANADSIEMKLDPSGYGPSDHTSFYTKQIPVLHFFTNTHADYHRPSDDWQRVDVAGVETIAGLVARTATELANAPMQPLTVVLAAPPPPRAQGGGSGAYLGTVPDFSPVEYGVKLSGVGPNSPAEKAGMRAGDVLVELGGKEVADLYAMTDALRAHKPGDRVTVVVLRDGERVSFDVVLGRRGS